MDSLKIPSVTPQPMRDQKLDIYLDDLRDRFKELRKQHDLIVEKSAKIIHEIAEASSEFGCIESKNNPKIKDLIRGFECVSSKQTGKRGPIIVLQNYEKFNEHEFFRESLNLFKRTKETLSKVDTHLEKMCSEKFNSKNDHFVQNHRPKINSKYQSRKIVEMQPARPMFSSCFSSSASLNIFKSVEDCRKDQHENNANDMGYQGDIDESEYDLHADKKRMGRMEHVKCDF